MAAWGFRGARSVGDDSHTEKVTRIGSDTKKDPQISPGVFLACAAVNFTELYM